VGAAWAAKLLLVGGVVQIKVKASPLTPLPQELLAPAQLTQPNPAIRVKRVSCRPPLPKPGTLLL
jgi:hypothetical protein